MAIITAVKAVVIVQTIVDKRKDVRRETGCFAAHQHRCEVVVHVRDLVVEIWWRSVAKDRTRFFGVASAVLEENVIDAK